MELIIDIPEKIYKSSKIINVLYEDVIQIPLEVIANGIPLPKGHGRLIDADKLWDLYHDLDYDFYEAIHDITTIIEADKAVEE